MKIDLKPEAEPKMGHTYKLFRADIYEMKKTLMTYYLLDKFDPVLAFGEVQCCLLKRKMED